MLPSKYKKLCLREDSIVKRIASWNYLIQSFFRILNAFITCRYHRLNSNWVWQRIRAPTRHVHNSNGLMSILSITYVFWWVDLHLHADYDYNQFFINNFLSKSNKTTIALLHCIFCNEKKITLHKSGRIIITIKLTWLYSENQQLLMEYCHVKGNDKN